MSWWRLRNPGSFPLEFHQAMQGGEGKDKLVRGYGTRVSAEAAQKDFRVFRHSLRGHLHDTTSFELGYIHRTRVAWNGDRQRWELLLTSRRKVLEDIAFMR